MNTVYHTSLPAMRGYLPYLISLKVKVFVSAATPEYATNNLVNFIGEAIRYKAADDHKFIHVPNPKITKIEEQK